MRATTRLPALHHGLRLLPATLGVWPIPLRDNTAEQIARKAATLGSAPITFISPARHLREKALSSVPGRDWKIECLPNGVDCDFFSAARKTDTALRRSFGVDPQATVMPLAHVRTRFSGPR